MTDDEEVICINSGDLEFCNLCMHCLPHPRSKHCSEETCRHHDGCFNVSDVEK